MFMNPFKTALHNAIWFTVYPNGSVMAEVLYHAADRPETYHFQSWPHCFSYFGHVMALSSDVEIRIQGSEPTTEPDGI